MKTFTREVVDADAMESLGRALGAVLLHGVVHLEGGLGAGKTTLCRGVLRARGHSGAVKSPTYTLVEPYLLAGGAVYHFDLYRLGSPQELELIGIRDYVDAVALCLIEWPERGGELTPTPDLVIQFATLASGRRLRLVAVTAVGESALVVLANG